MVYSHLVFRPPHPPSYTSQLTQLVWLKTRKGHHIPATYVENNVSSATILFSHANGEDLGYAHTYLQEICDGLGVNAFCYEYSGYGISEGKPSEANCYADIEAAYDYLVTERGIPWRQIIVMGRSLGSGPSIYICSRKPAKGLILVSPISSCLRVVRPHLKVSLPFDKFVNIDKIAQVSCPVLIIHGCMDEVVPVTNSIELYERCQHPFEPLWLPNGHHNDLHLLYQEDIFERFRIFLSYLQHCPLDSFSHSLKRPILRKIQEKISRWKGLKLPLQLSETLMASSENVTFQDEYMTPDSFSLVYPTNGTNCIEQTKRRTWLSCFC